MADLQVRFLNDLAAPIHKFTYIAEDGTELGEITCDPGKLKGWDEIRWLEFPEQEEALLKQGKGREARQLMIGFIEDWVTAQNPAWTPERILRLITASEAYHLLAFFMGRLRGAFATAAANPQPAPLPMPAKHAASKSRRTAPPSP